MSARSDERTVRWAHGQVSARSDERTVSVRWAHGQVTARSDERISSVKWAQHSEDELKVNKFMIL